MEVASRWLYWTIQSQNMLSTCFGSQDPSAQSGIEALVVAEWAEERRLSMEDIKRDFLGSADYAVRDLASWFSAKASEVVWRVARECTHLRPLSALP